ncbi:ADP-ribosylglycohydrolase [Kibdelosporangium banguiense]|uniref:ADP-ribosylglycohydrolase n=1 Tax=Kibdelosporangium banguiense TaxID=1365924 RepID=A0ABS4U2V6_9PSEU|nr:ADP-ribosylglycohydrolase family protein [Kibdelosporangium banguiense]MBP2330993.1 ADP-ribosylglycohydrolase [Kibdelosporangium banguiense]
MGDALGAQFFMVGRSLPDLRAGNPPAGPWEWTDDTEMACNLITELRDHGAVDQDRLAATFADRCEPYRGYGAGAFFILHKVRDGIPWQVAAGAVFNGQGSCGNGAAMRIAPLGAYFADDMAKVVEQATLSAEVTHQHPEGIVGAVAVAKAAAVASRRNRPSARDFLDEVLDGLAKGYTSKGIRRALTLLGRSVAEAAYELGNGSRVTAQDTVPFTLWVAATYLDDYPSAITSCIEAGGDIDTTGAIAGGIVAAHTGIDGVPKQWLAAREPLPDWAL